MYYEGRCERASITRSADSSKCHLYLYSHGRCILHHMDAPAHSPQRRQTGPVQLPLSFLFLSYLVLCHLLRRLHAIGLICFVSIVEHVRQSHLPSSLVLPHFISPHSSADRPDPCLVSSPLLLEQIFSLSHPPHHWVLVLHRPPMPLYFLFPRGSAVARGRVALSPPFQSLHTQT